MSSLRRKLVVASAVGVFAAWCAGTSGPSPAGGAVGAVGAVEAPQAELQLVLVLDGLRPDSINPTDTPNLHRLRAEGVNFPNSHAAVPTVTRVNSTVLGTGTHPGTNGIVGNSIYVPEVDPVAPFSTGEAEYLYRLQERTGRIALTPTLAERLDAAGKRFVAVGSGSSGGTLLLNPAAAAGVGTMINVGGPDARFASPDEVGAEVLDRFGSPPEEGTDRVDYAISVLTGYVLPDLRPDVAMTWMTEPDGAQHEHAVGSPEALATIRNDDRNIGRVLDALDELGLADRTNIMVVSDHGFSWHTYAVNVARQLVDAGLKADMASTDVVVANTGPLLVYVADRDPAVIRRIAEFLVGRDEIATVHVANQAPSGGDWTPAPGDATDAELALGWVPGTLSLEIVNQANAERGADLLVTLPWTSAPNPFGVPGTSSNGASGDAPTGPLEGPGSGHGSLSPWDIRNTFFAWGADIKDADTSLVPAGNVDVAPTIAALAGLAPAGDFDGRVLIEALEGGPDGSSVAADVAVHSAASPDGRSRGAVQISTVGTTRYVDFARRTTG